MTKRDYRVQPTCNHLQQQDFCRYHPYEGSNCRFELQFERLLYPHRGTARARGYETVCFQGVESNIAGEPNRKSRSYLTFKRDTKSGNDVRTDSRLEVASGKYPLYLNRSLRSIA